MKGEKAEYTVSLVKVFSFPKAKRGKRAITLLKRFAKKHARVEEKNVLISTEVNQKILEKGRFNPPRKIKVELKKEEKKLIVFLKGGKEEQQRIENLKEKEEKAKEKKKEVEEEIKKVEKGETKKEEETEKGKKEKKKLEEKRIQEKNIARLERGRKTRE